VVDFGIIVAKEIEEDAVLKRISNPRPVKHEQALKCTQGEWQGYSVVVVRTTRQGSVHSAIAAMDLARDFDPRYFVLIGIAAGFRKNVKLGSVIIADQVVGYEYSKRLGDSIEREPEPYRPPKILKLAPDIDKRTVTVTASKGSQSSHIVIGPIASGSKLVASGGFLRKLLDINRHMAGLEMEAEGVAAAAHHREEKPFLVFKAISDYGDKASKGARPTCKQRKLHDAAQLCAAEAAAEGFSEFLRIVRHYGSVLPHSVRSKLGSAVVNKIPAARPAEAEFLQLLSAGESLRLRELDLRCRLFPHNLWEADRRERAYQDNREKPTRLEIDYLKDAHLPDDALVTLSRLMTEIRMKISEHRAGRMSLGTRELRDLMFTERQLKREGSNPYPRLVATPEPFDIGNEKLLRITLGPSRYGISLIRERNLALPTAQSLRLRYVLNSLAVRVAVVHEAETDKRVIEFHQRSKSNGTYALAWDVGAAGYINSTDHLDPSDNKRISPWQTCVEEIETELKIPSHLLPHRDQYRFFGVGMNEPTGQLDLLALCHITEAKIPLRIPDGDRVIAYDACALTPEVLASFVRSKRKWVPTALLTMVFVLQYFGFSTARIEQAFSPLAGQLDLER
jgi:nucleoside phosphorylase